MVGKQPLQNTDHPSGYVSPVVYPPTQVYTAKTPEATERAVAANSTPTVPTMPGAVEVRPPQGWKVPIVHWRLPVRIRPENLGWLHLTNPPPTEYFGAGK